MNGNDSMTVPAEPFRRLLERYLQDKDQKEVSRTTGINAKMLWTVRNHERVRFDTADLIVSRCSENGPLSWRTEPDLKKIYDTFDLTPIDYAYPTCEVVKQEQVQEARSLRERLGRVDLVAKHIGIGLSAVNRLLKTA